MNIKPVFDSIFAKAKRPNFWFRVTGAALLTLIVFYVLFSFVDPGDVTDILSQVSLKVLLIGFVFYIGSTLFRAARFHVVHPKVSTRMFFSITSIHAMLTGLLPVKAGELTFPILLKRVDGSTFISSISTLFLVRVFDLIAILMLFFTALVMMYSQLDAHLRVMMLTFSLVFVIVLAIILSIIVFGKNSLGIARRMLFFDGLRNNRVTAWLFSKLELLFEGFNVVRKRYTVWRIMLFSILIWMCNYTAIIIIVQSMGLDLSLWVIMLGLTFTMIFSTLPINGLGSFGTLEAVWTIIFLSFGATKEVSFATGFGFHIFTVAYLIILGVLGMIHFIFLPSRQVSD